jgi:hypothetical protein
MSFFSKTIVSLLLTLLTVTSTSLADTTLDKYQDIVVSPKAPPAVRKAATDLQYHLQKIAGRMIPLVEGTRAPQGGMHFIVGSGVLPEQEAAISRLPREGWLIRSVPNGLLLAGNEEKLPISFYPAVSLFLEKHCGVRWVWPGESGEVIPQNPRLAIRTLNETGAPELKRRKFDFYYARFWEQQAKDELQRWSGRVRLGDQLRANFGHAWGALIPEDIYFKEHPEWFALVSGQRLPTQICPSNMQMRDEFVKRLLSLPGNKNLDIVSVSASDNRGFCECNLCRAKGTNDEDYKNEAYWDLVNDVAQRVKVMRPELGIGTFAYTISRNSPKKIQRLPDNVYLSAATYGTQSMIPEERVKYEEFITGWKSKGVKIIMREYWGMHYWLDLPIIYTAAIDSTFKTGRQAGMMGVYGECGKNFSTQAPNYYVLTHLMWDPTAEPRKILNEFYDAFGPASKPVRAYYELLENEVDKGWNKHKFGLVYSEFAIGYSSIFSPEVMAKAAAHLDEATRMAGNDTKLKERIAFIRIGCEYTTLMGELLGLYDKLGRTGFPLTAFEWEATARETRNLFKATGTAHELTHRKFFEKRLKQPFSYTLAEKDAWLMRAWELGQNRIELLNRNRSHFALDEGLYASTLEQQIVGVPERGIRRWQQTIGQFLGKKESDVVVLDYTHPVPKSSP